MQKIYIETSVVSYLTARPSKNIVIAGHQVITREFWDNLNLKNVFISELVLEEASKGDENAAKARMKELEDIKELEIDIECQKLAEILVEKNVVPKEFPEDALHIAIAAVHKIEVIATWNFKHINNPVTRIKIRKVIEEQGYISPEMCSPEEFIGENDE